MHFTQSRACNTHWFITYFPCRFSLDNSDRTIVVCFTNLCVCSIKILYFSTVFRPPSIHYYYLNWFVPLAVHSVCTTHHTRKLLETCSVSSCFLSSYWPIFLIAMSLLGRRGSVVESADESIRKLHNQSLWNNWTIWTICDTQSVSKSMIVLTWSVYWRHPSKNNINSLSKKKFVENSLIWYFFFLEQIFKANFTRARSSRLEQIPFEQFFFWTNFLCTCNLSFF